MVYHAYENRKTYCQAGREEVAYAQEKEKGRNQYVKCVNADHAYWGKFKLADNWDHHHLTVSTLLPTN